MFLTIKLSSVNKVYNDTKNGLKSINMFFINNSDSWSLKIIRFFVCQNYSNKNMDSKSKIVVFIFVLHLHQCSKI